MKFVKLNDNDLINLDLVEEIETFRQNCLWRVKQLGDLS